MRKLYQKFCNGDPISDKELEDGILFFRSMVDGLDSLGAEFKITTNELRRVLFSFENFKRARMGENHDKS